MSISAIAKYYNCSDVVIKKRISKYKIIKSKEKILDTIKSECINDYCWDNKKWLEDQYWKKKKSIREIASNVGSSEETIKSRLIKHNIKLRSLKEANKVSANSDEGRLLRSEISKDIWKNFDYKKRSSVIDKISMSLSGRNLTDKHKKNLSGTLKLKFKNPKCIKKHSNEMKKLWESPSDGIRKDKNQE